MTAAVVGGATPPAPAPSASPATIPADPEQTYEALDSFLQDQIQTLGIPGAAVADIRDGVHVRTAAFGRADDSGRLLTAQTPVLLASTSKTLTAIAVMQQVEAGRLRLDEPVQAYLPWFTLDDSRSSAVTVRHHLHQASGMTSNHRSASVLKMLSRLTMVSNFQVLTITTWTHATPRIEKMVSGHCR